MLLGSKLYFNLGYNLGPRGIQYHMCSVHNMGWSTTIGFDKKITFYFNMERLKSMYKPIVILDAWYNTK